MPSSDGPIDPQEPAVPDDLAEGELPANLVDAELEGCQLQGVSASSRDASGLRLSESRLTDVDFTDAVLARATIVGVVWSGGSLANARANNSSLRHARLEQLRATGLLMASSSIENVTFVDCRLDLSNFRFAALERVRFERCRLSEADFYEAKLKSTIFQDCDLSQVTWSGATFDGSELRGCDLAGGFDLQRLKGVRMPIQDIIKSAHEVARAAGIEVLDE